MNEQSVIQARGLTRYFGSCLKSITKVVRVVAALGEGKQQIRIKSEPLLWAKTRHNKPALLVWRVGLAAPL